MTVKLYLNQKYKHSQENRAFRHLCSAASAYLTGDAAIIGDIHYPNGQIDALVLGGTSITIVDFKDYGGAVRISENGEWFTDEGIRVAGGRDDKNPYRQILRYKNYLADLLSNTGLLPSSNDPRHISGLVMFTQPMAVDGSAMSGVARQWFCAAAQQDAMDFLRDRASLRLELSADCMNKIVSALGVKPFKLQPSETWVPPSAVEHAKKNGYWEAMQDVDDARQAEWWVENGDRIQTEYAGACGGWAIHDALTEIRRALERRHPGTVFAKEVVVALERALGGGKPPLSAILRTYQPRTKLDLTLALQNWGVEPGDFT
jgi:hypothetical protein